jgi:hypothetical protein
VRHSPRYLSISARANSIQGTPFVPSAWWMENAFAILYNFAEDENVVDLFVCESRYHR